MFLVANDYRVISVSYPVYWSLREYSNGFIRLLDHLRLDKVHVFGASSGGFIAQKIAESISNCQRIHSLILCNSFSDTSAFNQTESANLFWMMPAAFLRSVIRPPAPRYPVPGPKSDISEITDSILFVSELTDRLTQAELASRLTVKCTNSYVEPHRLQSLPVTIMDVFDWSDVSQRVREDLYKMYPNCRRAHLKTGGNYPYLSRPDEVNMHIVIHMRPFRGTRYSAQSCTTSQNLRQTPSPDSSDSPVDEAYELLS
jgi:maspardin